MKKSALLMSVSYMMSLSGAAMAEDTSSHHMIF